MEFRSNIKRIFLHLAFWSIYFFQNLLLIFFVNVTRLQKATSHELALAAANCLVLLLPKLLFTYFILSVSLAKIISGPNRKKAIGYSTLALLCTLIIYRASVVFIVNPHIYYWNDGQSLFYPLGFLVALMDVGFVSGAAIVIKQIRLQYAGKQREEALIREKMESELKFLRNQTNPHFLFNTLNNIYALARKKSDQTPEVVLKLSQLLRFMLYETAKPLIKIGDEVRILDDYIELEKLRYNNRLTVNFYREIDDQCAEISPLLLLPFVENAFKHGPGESHFDAYIHIEMILENGKLNFCVENTKERSGGNDVNESIGLKNVRRQLELLYTDFNMQVSNEESLFTVSLSINLKTHEKTQLSYR
jgi:hypothetical protein